MPSLDKNPQIESWISTIAASNPNLISKEAIGQTYEGRTMTLLKVGHRRPPSQLPEKRERIDKCDPLISQLGRKSSGTKPAIFLDCGIHAREWISPAFCQWFVKEVTQLTKTRTKQQQGAK